MVILAGTFINAPYTPLALGVEGGPLASPPIPRGI